MKDLTRSLFRILPFFILAAFLSCVDSYPLGNYDPCTTDADCPDGRCNVYIGECEAVEQSDNIYCRSDNDCDVDKGEICFYLTGTCRVACNSDDQCAEDEYCNIKTGICLEKGAGQTEYDDDDNDTHGDGELYDFCTGDDECKEGLECQDGYCIPKEETDDDDVTDDDDNDDNDVTDDDDNDDNDVTDDDDNDDVTDDDDDDDDIYGDGEECDLCDNTEDCVKGLKCVVSFDSGEMYCTENGMEGAIDCDYIGDDDDDSVDFHCATCLSAGDCGGQYECIGADILGQGYCAVDYADAFACISGGGGGGETKKPVCSSCTTADECEDGLDCVEIPVVGTKMCAADIMEAMDCMINGPPAGGECSQCEGNSDCNEGLECVGYDTYMYCTANGIQGAINCVTSGGGGLRSCVDDSDCIPVVESCMMGYCIPAGGGGGGFP